MVIKKLSLDVVPSELATAIIAEKGIATSANHEKLMALFDYKTGAKER